jgi:hypothetical protein
MTHGISMTAPRTSGPAHTLADTAVFIVHDGGRVIAPVLRREKLSKNMQFWGGGRVFRLNARAQPPIAPRTLQFGPLSSENDAIGTLCY